MRPRPWHGVGGWLVAVLAGLAPVPAWSQDLPTIVARINGTVITRAQLEARLTQSRSMNPERFDDMTTAERRRAMLRTLDSIVVREIEVQEAEKRGITVADEELDRDLNELKALAGTRGGLETLLAEYGTTLDEWMAETRRNHMIRELEQAEAWKLPVSESEVRDEFERNFWREAHRPPDTVIAEHRDHMKEVIRQRRWSASRREWLRPLIEAATIWRWTPGAQMHESSGFADPP